jgi:hypothetical protein
MALAFTQQVDIANHALQLLGVDTITAADFQSPVTKGGRETSRCYDKLRTAELRRNTWRFATRRVILRSVDPSTIIWTPPAYSSTVTYAFGQVVAYNGDYYQAQHGVAVGDVPDIATTWSKYFGPITCDPFDTGGNTSYFAGEITVVPELWGAGYLYAANTIIQYNGLFYVALQQSLASNPATSPTFWQPFAVSPNNTPPNGPYTYTSFNGGPVVWLCMMTQTGVTPQSPPAFPAAPGWLQVNGTPTGLQIIYPLGTGPGWEVTTNNIFRLPYGYLKKCPTNPKGQLTPPVGGPAYNQEEDYLVEGDYINSAWPGPILMRFIADVIDVSEMDEMFCRGLAASMALQICEAMTQANDKKQDAREEYKVVMGEARTINGIETGTVDPVEDEYIMVRL